MKYNYNGWFNIEADDKESALKKLKSIILDSLDTINGITELRRLNGAWKVYDFKGWFKVNARSKVEALKRAKIKMSKEKYELVGENEIEDVDLSDYLTDKEVSGNLSHFIMSSVDGNVRLECHSSSAADAWEHLRGNFIYDEHVLLFQHVAIPCAVSPKWRAMDVSRGLKKTPNSLGHQVVVAVGFAGEEWWGKNKDIIKIDNDGMIESATRLINALG